ncbi:hypothetical protein TSH7_25425 [Azospirillum sp. TSH7]|uniref:helix-turn-helix transcriptional regulator n=1 Tax=unclassified Azospirillum TaxID=2630922 RepID=UPI000D604870|nr:MULTISPECIES: LuxR family transcriptional regulator [unclassified Azospirillum]PWC57601.1 hypothetical protein TSH7_25425 [Azospirillum sp. TSH7]PWC67383.1 hypothetical protein TSH20_12600 [Azospirillum sp. TSH20]
MPNMFFDDIGRLNSCMTIGDVVRLMNEVADRTGFSGFSHLDIRGIGEPGCEVVIPFYLTTAREDFIAGYSDERLYEIDPVAQTAKLSNVAFSWSEAVDRLRSGTLDPAMSDAITRVIGFAADHGYRDGLTIPFHGVSRTGSPVSALTTLFWTGTAEEFARTVERVRFPLSMFMLYCNDRIVQLRGVESSLPAAEPPRLTGRERDCLSWSARGKTAAEIGIILGISENTANFHVKNCMRKLSVHSRSHAVAQALALRLIAL